MADQSMLASRFAKANGLTVVPQKIQPTDKDMTAQVQAIKAAGAKYIMLTSTPTQAASAVSIAEAQGFDATFMGNNPTFVPTLLSGPAKTALQKLDAGGTKSIGGTVKRR